MIRNICCIEICYSEISNTKGDATEADINRSGIDVTGLARPRSLPYSDLNKNLDNLKNSQKIKDLTKSKNCFESLQVFPTVLWVEKVLKCSGQCENLFKTKIFKS